MFCFPWCCHFAGHEMAWITSHFVVLHGITQVLGWPEKLFHSLKKWVGFGDRSVGEGVHKFTSRKASISPELVEGKHPATPTGQEYMQLGQNHKAWVVFWWGKQWFGVLGSPDFGKQWQDLETPTSSHIPHPTSRFHPLPLSLAPWLLGSLAQWQITLKPWRRSRWNPWSLRSSVPDPVEKISRCADDITTCITILEQRCRQCTTNLLHIDGTSANFHALGMVRMIFGFQGQNVLSPEIFTVGFGSLKMTSRFWVCRASTCAMPQRLLGWLPESSVVTITVLCGLPVFGDVITWCPWGKPRDVVDAPLRWICCNCHQKRPLLP